MLARGRGALALRRCIGTPGHPLTCADAAYCGLRRRFWPPAPPTERRSPDELPVSVKPREAWGAVPPVQPYVPHTPSRVTLHHTGAPWHGQPPVEQYLR